MKRVVLAIVAALVLIALPAAAQYNDQSAQTTSTAPTTTAPAQEVRTNPVVPMHSEDPGLTATGSVDSWNDDEVVLKTATGLLHFKLLPGTTGPRTFTAGQMVSIDFSRNEQGVLLANTIRPNEAVATMPPGVTTSGAAAAGEEIGAAVKNTGEAIEEGVEEATKTDLDNDNQIGTRGGVSGSEPSAATTTTTDLPATASDSPLFALLGLLALGAAAGLRRL
jgi:hypothetical protein